MSKTRTDILEEMLSDMKIGDIRYFSEQDIIDKLNISKSYHNKTKRLQNAFSVNINELNKRYKFIGAQIILKKIINEDKYMFCKVKNKEG